MPEERFLIVRLSSLGDIVLTAPAAAMLRGSFPSARIDWIVDRQWLGLFAGCEDFDEIISVNRNSWSSIGAAVRRLRARRYTCAVDFQGLYKSAIFAHLSGAPRRIGFARGYAREGGASVFYTVRVSPPPGHVADQNRALAHAAGAGPGICRGGFPRLTMAPTDVARRAASCSPGEFFVVNPGGGWGSKCWPAERYGRLCRELIERHGWRCVVNHGPGERELAAAVVRSAAPAELALFCGEIPELAALVAGAKFVVAGDTGPLHLAGAMGTPVIGLYGPTDPARSRPFNPDDIVVCNERFEGMMHVRGGEPAASMRSITVDQVLGAIARRLERGR